MNLELNLVEVSELGSTKLRLLDRKRYKVKDDTQSLDAIVKFIAENGSTFTAKLTDKVFVSKLQSLKYLTINDLTCLNYVLGLMGRMELKYWYVSDPEINPDEVPADEDEFNIIDTNNINGSFIPSCTKVTQIKDHIDLPGLYEKISDMYSLFSNNLFSTFNNPVTVGVKLMREDTFIGYKGYGNKLVEMNTRLELLKKQIFEITA